jgi:ABC-type phosphate/phosphonate transport system substrate-binding protein
MIRRSWRYSTLGLLIGLASLAVAQPPRAEMVRVGMVQTFFNDVPRVMIEIASEPFSAVMREATGMSGQFVLSGDAFDVARQLQAGQLQLGVFHSFELAWARQKHPELTPLMVVVNKHHLVRAYLLTRKDNPAASFADLKGKDLALPVRTKEHCRLFVKQRCFEAGQCLPRDFFGTMVVSENIETALDDLCAGKVQATVVDSLGLEFYRDLKPGCFARLKVLQQSELFPPAVIAYREGAIEEATLTRVRDGLINANRLALGREMMKMWKIHAFEPVPQDYAQSLAEILKAYPVPEPTAKLTFQP